MNYIFVPINNNGSRNRDYCCAVCLWSKPSLVISLLHQGAAAFFLHSLHDISARSFVGGLGLRVAVRNQAAVGVLRKTRGTRGAFVYPGDWK